MERATVTQSTAFATAPAGEDPTGRARSAADRPSDGAEAAVHRLAEGVELLGVFQDSGFQVPKYLLRRGDGQVMQLPRLLYGVASALDGRSAGEIATALSAELGVELTAGEVSFLVTDRLRPVGVIAADEDEDEHEQADRPPDGRGEPSPAAPVKSDPLLSLRYRVGVVPAGVVSRVAGVLRPLFARPVWPVALAVFIGVGVLIIQQGGLVDQLTAGLLQLIHKPSLILVVLALGVVGSVFHECGHVTACRYGGATPGDMGVGL